MKIIFTSCTRYEAFNKQPNWNTIYNQNPDYLFLLGDTIYMDYGWKYFSNEPNGSPRNLSDKDFGTIMEKKYINQFENVPEFRKLVEKMKAKNGFYAIWDDHDFAWNDCFGSDNDLAVKKKISRKLFHKYTECTTNHPHVYYHVDTPEARVIFIDNRFDSEASGQNSKIISNEQFDFIKEKLNHELKYTLICGGITLTEGHEKWSNYPTQLKKLCLLLKDKKNVIFLAGDIHKNRFKEPLKIAETELFTPPQLISSGMYVNYLGLGLPFDNKKNWAMIEIEKDKFDVSFFNRFGKQNRKSRTATAWFQKQYKS
jgi:predicted phosphodiesterase